MGITMFVTLYISRVLIQILGITDYGIYNVVAGFIVAYSFINGALSTASSRFITVELGKKNYVELTRYFNSCFYMHLGASILMVIIAETVGLYFIFNQLEIPHDRQMAAHIIYQLSIIQIVFKFLLVPLNATIIAHERMGIFAYMGIAVAALQLFPVLLLTDFPFDKLVGYGIIMLGVDVCNFFFLLFFCLKKFKECTFQMVWEKKYYKNISSFIGFDLIGNIAGVLQTQGVNILLNLYGGPNLNASRAISYQVEGGLRRFSDNFMTALKPQIIKSFAMEDYERTFSLIFRGSILSFWLFGILSIPFIYNANEILYLWLNTLPDYVVIFTIIVLLTSLELVLETPFTFLIIASGRNKYPNIIVGCITIISFFIIWIALEMGCSYFFTFLLLLLFRFIADFVTYYIIQKQGYIPNFKVKRIFKKLYIPLYISFIIGCFISYLMTNISNSEWSRFIMTSLAGDLFFSLSLFYFVFTKAERNSLTITIKNLISNHRNHV